MNKKQKVFYILIFIIYLLLMLYCYLIHDYKTIIKSTCILIGSFIFEIVYSKLGADDIDKW